MSAHASILARRFRLALLFVTGLVVLLGGALLAAPWAIEHFGERALRSAGFEDAEIASARLALDGVRIRRLRLAGEGRFVLRDIAIRFSWESLWAGRAQRLSIADARLDAAIGAAGRLRLPGLAAKAESQRDGGGLSSGLPVETLVVDSATLNLATPAGTGQLILTQMRARPKKRAIRLRSALRVRHAAGSARGHIEATARVPHGPVSVQLAITEGRISAMQTEVAGLHGEVRVMLPAQGPAEAAVDLTAGASAYREIGLGPLNLSASLRGAHLRYRLTSPPAATVALDLGGEADLAAQRARVAGPVRLPSLARLPRFDAAGRVALTCDLALDWGAETPRVSGQLALEATALALEGFVRQGHLQLASDIDATAERIALTARAPWRGEGVLARRLLPPALQSYAGERLRLRLGPREAAGAAHLTFRPGAGRVVLDTAAALAAGETRVQAGSAFRMQIKNEAIALSAQPLTLSFEALRLADLTVGLETFTGRAELRPERTWQLVGAGRVRASGAMGPATLEGGRLTWRGRLEGDRAAVRMIPTQCLRVAAAAVTVRDRRFEALDPPCLARRADAPLLRYAFATGRLYVAARSESAPLDLRLRVAEKSHRVTGRWPALTVVGQGGAQGLENLQVSLKGGALQLAEAEFAAEGIAGTLAISDGAIEKARLSVSAVKSLARPALWVPLELEATASGEEGQLAFEALLSDPLGLVVFQAQGQSSGGTTRADLTLYPIQFIPQATEPGDLSPALGALVSDMTGRIGFDGRLTWDEGALTSGGELRLDELAATLAGLRFEGLDGALALASLVPPVTEGVQTLRLAAANIGLLLTDGRLRFVLLPGARLRVAELAFALGGGQLTAEPFTLDLSQLTAMQVILHAKHVDLAEVARMSGLDGVEAEGELTGRLPISLGAEGLRVAGGRLRAAGEGVLRYVPREMPAFLQGDDVRTRMLRQVLQNFQYKRLSLTLAGEVGAEQQVHLEARGANPDFLEGHPVILNVRVNGPLVSVVKSALGGAHAEALKRLFKDSEQSPPMPQEEGSP